MRVIECATTDEAAELVASEILTALRQKPDLVLGLATGSTPVGVYERLVRAHREQRISFARVRTFNLDEYVGLRVDHPQCYRSFMHKHLFAGLDVPPANTHFPPVEQRHLAAACAAYERAIRDTGGIDMQILGIGSNGHIGFNEPTSSLASRTRVKTLADKTLADNARFYGTGEKQPQLATTMGIGTILEARRIPVESPDGVLHCIGEIEPLAVRIPAQRVGQR